MVISELLISVSFLSHPDHALVYFVDIVILKSSISYSVLFWKVLLVLLQSSVDTPTEPAPITLLSSAIISMMVRETEYLPSECFSILRGGAPLIIEPASCSKIIAPFSYMTV